MNLTKIPKSLEISDIYPFSIDHFSFLDISIPEKITKKIETGFDRDEHFEARMRQELEESEAKTIEKKIEAGFDRDEHFEARMRQELEESEAKAIEKKTETRLDRHEHFQARM
jgi:hypothetical protein